MIKFSDVYLNLVLIEKIIERDGKWIVTNKNGTKILGTHDNKKDALSQLRAIEISKHSK